MNKRQIITIALLAVVIAGLTAGYIFIKNYNEKKELEEAQEEEAGAALPLCSINTEEIESITYTYNGNSVILVNDDGLWEQKDTGVPIAEDKIQEMLDAVASIDAIKVITDKTDNIAEYGLDEPTVSYTIALSDGTSCSIAFGLKLTTMDSAYYALYNDDGKVYSMSSNYYYPFAVTLADITAIYDEVDVEADNITGLDISTKDGYELQVRYLDEADQDKYYTWEIIKPYSGIFADTDRLKVKLNAYGAIKYKSCVAYNAEDYTEYGLAEPFATIKIDYYTVEGAGEESETTPDPDAKREYNQYTLEIGDEVTIDEEQYYYVRPSGSANIYIMEASNVLELYDYKAYEVADSCIYSELIDNINGFDVEYGNTRLVIERKDEKPNATPEPGAPKKKKDTINVYYVNGKKVDEQEALNLYSFAYLLVNSGEASADKEMPGAEPALVITYHPKDGEDVVVKFLPYKNENFYQVDKNGMKYFLTDKRGIDTLINNYEEFIKNNLH